MYCSRCGKDICKNSIVCIHCGCSVARSDDISNKNKTGSEKEKSNESEKHCRQSGSGNSRTMYYAASKRRIRRTYSLPLDIFMSIITCGAWIIWIIFRPKYY